MSVPPLISSDANFSNINVSTKAVIDQIIQSKLSKTNLTPVTISDASDVIYTGSQLFGGLIIRNTSGAPRTDTIDIAANLINVLSILNNSFVTTIDNIGANTITVVGGSGVTIENVVSIESGKSVNIKIIATNVLNGTEAFSVYNLTGTGSGGGGSTPVYRQDSITAVTVPANASPVLFDTNLADSGTIVIAIGVYTLPTGSIYKLSGSLKNDISTSTNITYQWRVVTGAVTGLVGNIGSQISNTVISNLANNTQSQAIVNASVATTVHLEILSGGGIGTFSAGHSNCFIEKM